MQHQSYHRTKLTNSAPSNQTTVLNYIYIHRITKQNHSIQPCEHYGVLKCNALYLFTCICSLFNAGVSNSAMQRYLWIGKDVEGTGHGPIKVISWHCLERLRKPRKISEQSGYWPRSKRCTCRMQVRSHIAFTSFLGVTLCSLVYRYQHCRVTTSGQNCW
jgi:hypothetical protein